MTAIPTDVDELITHLRGMPGWMHVVAANEIEAQKNRADAAEKSAREWETDHDEVLELYDKLADRLALIQEQLAEAWERGFDAQNDVDKHAWPLPPNPYRSEATA